MRIASSEQIEQSRQMISQSASKVLVVGGGSTSGREQITRLAEKLNCPVLSTVAGRGVLPSDHPLSAGAQLRAPYVQRLLEQSDLAIFLGTEFAQTDHWNDEMQLPQHQIWVNLCPTALQRGGETLAIQADCADFAQQLADSLPEQQAEMISSAHQFCEQARDQGPDELTERERKHLSVLSVVKENISIDTTIVSDMTQIAYTAVDYLTMSRPNQWLHPTGYGTLGYALPAGIGAVLADESNPHWLLSVMPACSIPFRK